MNYESFTINGDGNYSRVFTYIINVIQMNAYGVACINLEAVNTFYNIAFGDLTTLTKLVGYFKEFLAKLDIRIADVSVIYGLNRAGDILHSLTSIEKAIRL